MPVRSGVLYYEFEHASPRPHVVPEHRVVHSRAIEGGRIADALDSGEEEPLSQYLTGREFVFRCGPWSRELVFAQAEAGDDVRIVKRDHELQDESYANDSAWRQKRESGEFC